MLNKLLWALGTLSKPWYRLGIPELPCAPACQQLLTWLPLPTVALGGFTVKTSFLRAAASGRIQSECVKGTHLHSVLLLLHDLPFEGFLGIAILVLFTFDRSQLHLALKAPADFFDSVYRQSLLDPCVKGVQVRA